MNRCRLFLLSVSIIAFIVAFLEGCASPQETKATPPGETISDGLLTFTAWDQQTVSENPRHNLFSLQIEHAGKSNESVSLKRLSLKFIKADRTEQIVEEKDINVKSGNPFCVSVSIGAELSKLEIRAEDPGKKYGPFIYDFALSNSGSKDQKSTSEATDTIDVSTTELQFPEGKRCFVDTSLGCLYQIGKMTVTKIAKTTTEKNFVVLSFKGKGVLQFEREEFSIRDAESNNSYLWSHWAYNGKNEFLPGSASGPYFSGSFGVERGPVRLRDCWQFEVFYEVPENVHRVKLDFKSDSKANGSSN